MHLSIGSHSTFLLRNMKGHDGTDHVSWSIMWLIEGYAYIYFLFRILTKLVDSFKGKLGTPKRTVLKSGEFNIPTVFFPPKTVKGQSG